MYKKNVGLYNLESLICNKTQPNQIIYLTYMYEKNLELYNLQWLVCNITQPNQTLLVFCTNTTRWEFTGV